MDAMVATFMTQRRDMMVKRVDEELCLAENRKRTQDRASEDGELSKRVKLTAVGLATTGLQHANSIYLSPCASTQLTSDKMHLPYLRTHDRPQRYLKTVPTRWPLAT
jgi:hypothetical protein